MFEPNEPNYFVFVITLQYNMWTHGSTTPNDKIDYHVLAQYSKESIPFANFKVCCL
jgi:hypothetical protein